MPSRKRASELRKWERLPLAIPVFIRGTDDRGKQFLEFSTLLNISGGGALLAVRSNLATTAEVSLEIPAAPLPRSSMINGAVRVLAGRPTRLAYSNGCNMWGLQFKKPLT